MPLTPSEIQCCLLTLRRVPLSELQNLLAYYTKIAEYAQFEKGKANDNRALKSRVEAERPSAVDAKNRTEAAGQTIDFAKEKRRQHPNPCPPLDLFDQASAKFNEVRIGFDAVTERIELQIAGAQRAVDQFEARYEQLGGDTVGALRDLLSQVIPAREAEILAGTFPEPYTGP